MNKIAVIIVTYNGMKWIEQCLNSVVKSSISVSLIVIDNCSIDGTANYIKTNFPNVIVFEQKENLGFGRANNFGMSYALKQNADFVFLLNQDAFVDKNTIEKLVAVSIHKPEYGIISPIHLNGEGTALEWYFSGFMNMDNSPNFYSDYVLNTTLKEIYETKFVNAAAWLLPRRILKEIGGFDPIFWHYGEDDNYCQRILYHGYKIGVVPNIFVRHDGKRRFVADNYLFSVSYFNDFVKRLQISYANINITYNKHFASKEKNKVIKAIVKSAFKLNFYSVKQYHRQFRLIDVVFVEIVKSRKKVQEKFSHYLD